MRRLVSVLTLTATATTMLVVPAPLAVGEPAPPTAAAVTANPGATPAPVRVATYNIANSRVGKGKFAYATRRLALPRNVASANPDVLLVQEASTMKWRGIRLVDDVRARLAPIGYRIASTDYTGCSAGCTRGAHVFYNTKRMRLAQLPDQSVVTGMTGLAAIAGTWRPGIQDRAVSWAFLTPVGANRPTLYLSVHLPTQKNAAGEELRQAVARHLDRTARSIIARSGLKKAEIVIGGDFNSYARRQPTGAQAIVAASGLIDGATAPAKVNVNYGSVNYAPKIAKYKGFPPKPYFYKRNTTRIDYVFSSVQATRHEVVLKLTGRGRFDNKFRASDHNMVMVSLPLG